MKNSIEAKGVAIGCNYALKLMKEAYLIPIEICRLEDAIDYIISNPIQQYSFQQVEALMNASFYLGADSGLHRAFERLRDRTFVVDNRYKNPRVLRNEATTTTQFSFTENYSGVRLNCRIHIPDSSFDGFTTDYRQLDK
ncbi:TPA: hypothetical protein ACGD2I_003753 [Aeromonas hydrophila]|uniref:hypothetical protein n=1 Tax=Aeromonas hydrophila TaxID=644 RepID=UPI00107E7776|nr:hypothetical protein [Aeromonas hydrophila]MCV3294751.1 hypothetical protein [Aeromonas hydrophila]QBX70067.1 hypothetical protein E4625_03850 [Aeromonas hydrophila]QBX74798.1 hypothetical protein E4630_03850 [Aeromonas hydrophila]WDA25195.1 hypothetical protein PSC74_01995 [Aeromonas hydrophila]WES95250.1 hypothetical protein PY368_10645 [Aeromonas hydrophila]